MNVMVSAAFSSEIEPSAPASVVRPSAPAGPLPVPALSRAELALVVGLSVIFHGGVALAALASPRDEVRAKPPSRVQIAIQRARPASVPPPPTRAEPPAPKPQARAVPAPAVARPATPSASAAPSEPAPEPIDTGSSAPAAADGELFAGSGGLGVVAPTPPPAPLPPPKVEPKPAVVAAHEGANYLKNPRPAYPSLARRKGWEGTTLLRVQVSTSGRPAAISVQRSSGHSALDDAATEAAKRWTFVPAMQAGAAVAGWVTVPVVFRLQ